MCFNQLLKPCIQSIEIGVLTTHGLIAKKADRTAYIQRTVYM